MTRNIEHFRAEIERLAKCIHDSLPEDERATFFHDFNSVVQVNGKDLSLIHWKFLLDELRKLPKVLAKAQNEISLIAMGIEYLADGGDWSSSQALAATFSARSVGNPDTSIFVVHAAAYAAANAARAAAGITGAVSCAASYAARAAPDLITAIRRQRDTLLRLIKEAPVVQEATS